MVHEDAKVVAQIGAGNAKGPHGGEDEDIARRDETVREVIDKRTLQGWVRWLRAEGALIAEGKRMC